MRVPSLFKATALLLCLLAFVSQPVRGDGPLMADPAPAVAGDLVEARGLRGAHRHHRFHIQLYRKGRRFHSRRGSWIAFSGGHSGGDGHVVTEVEQATWFYIEWGHLRTSWGWYVHLEFSNGYAVFKAERHKPHGGISYYHNGDFLEIWGPWMWHGWGHGPWQGWGQGQCCVGDDGIIFVEGNGHTPFRCHGIDIRPNPGPTPLPSPTQHGPPPPPPTGTWADWTVPWTPPSTETHTQPPTATSTNTPSQTWADWTVPSTNTPTPPPTKTSTHTSSQTWADWTVPSTSTHTPSQTWTPTTTYTTTATPNPSSDPDWEDWEIERRGVGASTYDEDEG